MYLTYQLLSGIYNSLQLKAQTSCRIHVTLLESYAEEQN